jgi:hypothetical protein
MSSMKKFYEFPTCGLAHVWGEIAFRVPSGARIFSVFRGFLSEVRVAFEKM